MGQLTQRDGERPKGKCGYVRGFLENGELESSRKISIERGCMYIVFPWQYISYKTRSRLAVTVSHCTRCAYLNKTQRDGRWGEKADVNPRPYSIWWARALRLGVPDSRGVQLLKKKADVHSLTLRYFLKIQISRCFGMFCFLSEKISWGELGCNCCPLSAAAFWKNDIPGCWLVTLLISPLLFLPHRRRTSLYT